MNLLSRQFHGDPPYPYVNMLSKFIVSFSLHHPFLSPPYFFPKPSFFSLLSDSTAAAAAAAISYGPSISKGTLPFTKVSHPINPSCNSNPNLAQSLKLNFDEDDAHQLFDEMQFTREFEVSALRVPSEHCFALEGQIRGHLLNWPRIPNIARVPGDEVDEEIVGLVANKSTQNEDEVLRVLSRRIYGKSEGDGEELSPVLYRDKLAKEFNARGFVKFRNLARISRPKKKKKRREKEERQGVRRKSVVVEVVEERGSEDLSGLLGDEFKGGKWRGSTRLLLLDERYVGRDVHELPEAVQAVFKEGSSSARESRFELVRCKLTLFYDYWPMNEVLEGLLPKGMVVPSAFETVGHIAHLNLREEHLPYRKLIARVVLDKNKRKIQTVVNKTDAINNDYRTMQLEVLAGNHSLVTAVIENGLRFQVDLAAVYWNSRLATERQRLLSCFTSDDVVCDVFAGVGPIAIAAAKKVKRVYANDLNPHAIDYLERNSVLNKLERKIQIFNMDGRRFIEAMFSSEQRHSITQVVMNLPNDAAHFLDAFKGIFKGKAKDKSCALPVIYVYGFSKAEDPDFDFHERIRIALSEVAFAVEMRRVRLVAPGKWMLCATFRLPETVAYGRTM